MSATSTRIPHGMEEETDPAPAGKVAEAGPQFVSGRRRSYAEEQRRARRRSRIVKFAVCASLWALGTVPLALEIAGGGGAEIVLAYLAVAAASLGIAAAIRGAYVLLVKRPLLSPAVFLMAAVLAIATYAVQTAGEPEPAIASATPELQQAL